MAPNQCGWRTSPAMRHNGYVIGTSLFPLGFDFNGGAGCYPLAIQIRKNIGFQENRQTISYKWNKNKKLFIKTWARFLSFTIYGSNVLATGYIIFVHYKRVYNGPFWLNR